MDDITPKSKVAKPFPGTSTAGVSDLGTDERPGTLDAHLARLKSVEAAPEQIPTTPTKAKQPMLKIILIAVTVLGIGTGAAFGYMKLRPKQSPAPTASPTPQASPTPVPTPAPTPVPTTKASPLTGLLVPIAAADRQITAVVIENHTDARPQSGLGQAGVVYEALAEGGITRFLAFFLDSRPASLGPIRSLRTYFIDWAKEYNAPVAHVGGNADALDLVGPTGLRDMNQFYNSPAFFRTTDRVAPHNMYSTSDLLDALEQKLGFATPTSFVPTPRKADTPQAAPSHPKVTINYSYSGYNVEYRFDAATDSYLRFLAGAPHIDRNTNAQITVKNVVVEYMPTSYGTTRIGEQTVIMTTVGNGKALVFIDGGVIEGTWQKTSRETRTRILDSTGAEIQLNAGNTWYSIVPVGKSVAY